MNIVQDKVSFTVTYDDNTTEVLTPAEYLINETIWKYLPNDIKGITKRYSITSYYTNGMFTSNAILSVYTAVLEDILYDETKDPRFIYDTVQDFAKRGFTSLNEIYNEVGLKSQEYMITLSLKELLEIQTDPRLIEAIRILRDNEYTDVQSAIKNIYKTLDIVLRENANVNMVAASYVNKSISGRQLEQCLGLRGLAADLDSTIFADPIKSNYTLGLTTMYETAVDSRGAATALYFSGDAIRNTETFAKKIQTLASVVKDLSLDDCGTTRGMKFTLVPPGENEYGEHYIGDLATVKGNWYKTSENGEWKLLKGDEKHLENTDIWIRTPYYCEHPDKHTVCIKCLGILGYHKPRGFDLGLWLISKLTEVINQLVLSTKHYIASAVGDKVKLSDIAKQYLMEKEGTLRLIKGKYKEILISLKDFYGYKNIDASNVDTININKVSRIYSIRVNDEVLEVSHGGKPALLTLDFIKHIIRKSEIVPIGNDNYLKITLSGWKYNQPILTLIDSTFDYKRYGKSIMALINGQNTAKYRNTSRDEMLMNLFRTINRKIPTNISVMGIIPYIMSCRNIAGKDFRLTRGDEYDLCTTDLLLAERSVSTIYSMGGVQRVVSKNTSDASMKDDSVFDALYAPNEVIAKDALRVNKL